MINFAESCEHCRYSHDLEELLRELKAEKILKLEYESDYQGFVDADVLLADGRVFSYYYGYGSCSGCDDWENRNLNDEEIKIEMLKEATFFDDQKQYNEWVSTQKKPLNN